MRFVVTTQSRAERTQRHRFAQAQGRKQLAGHSDPQCHGALPRDILILALLPSSIGRRELLPVPKIDAHSMHIRDVEPGGGGVLLMHHPLERFAAEPRLAAPRRPGHDDEIPEPFLRTPFVKAFPIVARRGQNSPLGLVPIAQRPRRGR